MAYTSGWKGYLKELPHKGTSSLVLTSATWKLLCCHRVQPSPGAMLPDDKQKAQWHLVPNAAGGVPHSKLPNPSDQTELSKDTHFQKDVGDALPACHHRTTPSTARGHCSNEGGKTNPMLLLFFCGFQQEKMIRPLRTQGRKAESEEGRESKPYLFSRTSKYKGGFFPSPTYSLQHNNKWSNSALLEAQTSHGITDKDEVRDVFCHCKAS
ncbi:uncharacterized protein LOC127381886 isoform X2 [Apus apus]|uniref:uncharacterized protein LOC127381886 isoform X2 n=1 Tax=Apus apus TaxID=8895 RepID=UPI0021F85896|nr:uncharacterized protein LOC127381886 isoform X2 [Apus apus]